MTAFLRRFYAGGGTTTNLANAVAATDTTFIVNSVTGWPGSPGNNFIVVLDRGVAGSEEKILCSQNSGTTVTVAGGLAGRGYDGTAATTHNANATASLCGGAIDFDEDNQISNFLGNVAKGSIILGAGTGTLPSSLAALAEGALMYGKGTGNNPVALTVGAAGAFLGSNGTDPIYVLGPSANVTTAATCVSPTGFAGPNTGTMPAVTITTLTTALVTCAATWVGSVNADVQGFGFAVSGATTIAASVGNGTNTYAVIGNAVSLQKTVLLTGLTPGSNVFTFKGYTNGASTETFTNMSVIVQPLAV